MCLAVSAPGQEDQSPPIRLKARCRFGQALFAVTHVNGPRCADGGRSCVRRAEAAIAEGQALFWR
jgi:hypothetical protein